MKDNFKTKQTTATSSNLLENKIVLFSSDEDNLLKCYKKLQENKQEIEQKTSVNHLEKPFTLNEIF